MIFLLIITYSQSYSQDYLWPTNASTKMTSSFCEFRPRHYHAAIDIKTWNETGYRVYAIQNGYVMRIRVSAFGYGKAIYLRLDDGNIVVYAHLEKFTPELDAYVDEIRYSRQEYNIDTHLKSNQFPVKKGQLIGYTGKTGIGVPHLHFEIRNSKNEPINPLQFYKQDIDDKISPELDKIAFIPQTKRSLINFKPDTLLYHLYRRPFTQLPDTLNFSGEIAIALKSYDKANGTNNFFSFYKANMWIDDSLVYSVQYDHFSYHESKQVEIDKNYSLWRKQEGIFHNFFRHPLNTLSHYNNTPKNGGIIDCEKFKAGLHSLRIALMDYWENTSQLHMTFRTGTPVFLQYDLFQQIDSSLFMRIQSPEKLSHIILESWQNPNSWKTLAVVNNPGALEHERNYFYTFSFPVKDSSHIDQLRIQGIQTSGYPTFPLYIFNNSSRLNTKTNKKLELVKYRLKKNWIELITQVYHYKPYLYLYQIEEQFEDVYWFPLSENIYQINIPISEFLSRIEFVQNLFNMDIKELGLVNRNSSLDILSPDQYFAATYPVEALYNETAVYLKDNSTIEGIYIIEPPYQQVGKIYDLQPFDQPVKNGVFISLTVPDSIEDLSGLGLYYWDFKKGWLFIPSTQNKGKRQFSTTVTSMEKFTLIRDTVPPLITPLEKVDGKKIKPKNGIIKFFVKDEMSGIYKESQIQIYLDQKWHLFEYDPEEDFIIIKVPFLRSEPSTLFIKVEDNAGNKIEEKYLIQ